jgi:4-carboxymuconolactone decarboxylase
MSTSEAYRQGLNEIIQIDPVNGPIFVEELKKLSPDFAEYFVGFAFGKIHSRSVLDSKVKELIAIASLTAIGYSQSHLKLRILGAIRAGCSKEEIMEVIIQSVVYVGFMKTTTALNLVKEVFEEHASLTKHEPNS